MAEGFTIKIEGVKELQNKFKEIDNEIQDIITEAVRESGELIKAGAKSKVHVITGRLRDSIDVLHVIETPGKSEAQIGSNMFYADVEEFRVGGKYPGPHSYMRWALDNYEKDVVTTIENKLRSSLSRYR